MTVYAVLAPPARAHSAEPEPDRFVFVKEGFCWPALYMTIPWLIWHGMWLVVVAYLVAGAAVFALATAEPLPAARAILILFSLLVGLEANNLRRWTLERRGYQFLGVTAGDRKSEAEYRFFLSCAQAATQAPGTVSGLVALKPTGSTPDRAGAVVGLFPMAGARP